ncbi:hypothetical protein JHK82_046041 [Glycine max]|nr:hypothetical protein JHK82_046041 [Glycine max]
MSKDYLIILSLLLSTVLATASSSSSSSSLYLGKGFSHRKLSPSYHIHKTIDESYAVIFDAGSTGSRVHVYRFNQQLDLLRIGQDLELFVKTMPGLSAYAENPQDAAESLIPLLEEAEAAVPQEFHPRTPATAGLRQLEGDASDRILQAVSDMLKNRSTLNVGADAVSVLSGNQEGAYQWVTINYLLGNLGKHYSETVAVVDLGGGSVQMAYAVSETDAAKAPRAPDGAGFVDPNAPNAKVRPVDFENAAKVACNTELKDLKSIFPRVKDGDVPYICLDLVYEYTLLVDGFGIDPQQEITLVRQVEYQDSLVEAAWPLGSAIEAISSLPKFEKLMYFI